MNFKHLLVSASAAWSGPGGSAVSTARRSTSSTVSLAPWEMVPSVSASKANWRASGTTPASTPTRKRISCTRVAPARPASRSA